MSEDQRKNIVAQILERHTWHLVDCSIKVYPKSSAPGNNAGCPEIYAASDASGFSVARNGSTMQIVKGILEIYVDVADPDKSIYVIKPKNGNN